MTNLSFKDIAFTGGQFLLFFFYLFDFHLFEVKQILPDFILGIFTAIGLALSLMALFQLNTRLSPFPRPKSNSILIKNGVFKYIRHPIYSGLFIGLLAYGIYAHSSSKIIIDILLLVWFYFKSKYEEELLQQKFSDYKEYREQTGRFFPKLNVF